MKIGDIVIRAYAYPAIIPGIIVDQEIEIVTAGNEDYAYEDCNFVVQWSDGSQSTEMYEELEYFLQAVEAGALQLSEL